MADSFVVGIFYWLVFFLEIFIGESFEISDIHIDVTSKFRWDSKYLWYWEHHRILETHIWFCLQWLILTCLDNGRFWCSCFGYRTQ